VNIRILFDGRWIRPDKPDGITRYSRELIKALRKKGIEIDLLVNSDAQAENLDINKSITVPVPTKILSSKKALAGILNRTPYNLYLCPHFLQLLHSTNTPSALTCHDLTPWQYRSQSASRAWKMFHGSFYGLRTLLRKADYVLTVSNAAKKDLAIILPEADIRVVYNGVAANFYNVKPAKTKKQILYVGRYEEYKNVELAIAALKELPNYSLVCVGSISDERKMQLAGERVHFVGVVNDTRYLELLSESHSLIMPSRAEGFGLPVVEAMAAGLPVICSNLDVFHEIGGNSLEYVITQDGSHYAQAIKKLEDTSLRKQRISSARMRSREFTWEKAAEAVLALCTIE